MISQKEAFLDGEGDAWFDRNPKETDSRTDPVIEALLQVGYRPVHGILEIGCGSGGQLAVLREMFGTQCHGIEPSEKAVRYGSEHYPGISIRRGSADTLPFENGRFDLVIFGFCLYLCDPIDHFSIISSADRVLADKGLLAIFDFAPPQPYANTYRPMPELYSYKMQFATLFLSHPSYRLVSRRYFEHGATRRFDPDEAVTVDVLRKDVKSAFPANPWRELAPGKE